MRSGEPIDYDTPFWQAMIPTNYLADISGAIQLQHAVDDDVVNVGYSRDLAALLAPTAIVHELRDYPTGGHNFTGGTFNLAASSMIDFFRQHLGVAE
jgi:predicted esterase